MERGKVVLVRCAFLRGAFPHERIFVIRLGDGWEYRGVAHVRYCFTTERHPLGDVPQNGSEVNGLVVGLQIAPAEGNVARVQLPDGEIYELTESMFASSSPTGRDIHVPVES